MFVFTFIRVFFLTLFCNKSSCIMNINWFIICEFEKVEFVKVDEHQKQNLVKVLLRWDWDRARAHLTARLRSRSLLLSLQPASGWNWCCRRCSSCLLSWWGWLLCCWCCRPSRSSRCSTGSCPSRCSTMMEGSGGGCASDRRGWLRAHQRSGASSDEWKCSPEWGTRDGIQKNVLQVGHCWHTGRSHGHMKNMWCDYHIFRAISRSGL